MSEEIHVDPFDEGPEPDPRYAGPLVVVAWVLSVVAVVPTGLAFVVGPLGMTAGLVAHAKGHPGAFRAAVAAGIATVLGLCVQFLLLGGISGNA